MPKKIFIHPNQRVDLSDFNKLGDLPIEQSNFVLEKSWTDLRSRILSGFRVELANQTSNPGQVTVHNGNYIDRSGRLVTNEAAVNDSRSVTLSGSNTTFYIEVEFIETESDVETRAFWDPTVENIDPVPDGAEVSLASTTRLTPDWRVVTPVSTTGFTVTTNPNTNRIPIAALTTNGSNQITVGVNIGLTLVNASTVLEGDVANGVTSIRVLNSVLLPSSGGQIIVDFGSSTPETVTVSANDRVNGIVTFAPALASSHLAGAIVRTTGVTQQFIAQNTNPNTTAHPDKSPKMFTGDEVRGSALQVSKETFGARDDLNLRNLKDYVDFVSAQLREMKFGQPRPGSFPTSAPPLFSGSSLRYFDRSPSLVGSKSTTFTIGDGVSSVGDLTGNTQAVFASAIAALPATGGIIYVKSGTYNFSSAVTIDRPVLFIGESRNGVVINDNVAGNVVFNVNMPNPGMTSGFQNVQIAIGTGAAPAIQITGPQNKLVLENATIPGVNVSLTGNSFASIIAVDCTFTATGASCLTVDATDSLNDSMFYRCVFSTATNATNCVLGSFNRVCFEACSFTNTTTNDYCIVTNAASSALVLEDCTFSCRLAVNTSSGALTDSSFRRVNVSHSSVALGTNYGIFNMGSCGTILFENIRCTNFSVTSSTTTNIASFLSASPTAGNSVEVRNCSLISTAAGAQFTNAISITGSCSISSNYFFSFASAMRVSGGERVLIANNEVAGNGIGGFGLQVLSSCGVLKVEGNSIVSLARGAGDINGVIAIQMQDTVSGNYFVSDNKITTIGIGVGALTGISAGISFVTSGVTSAVLHVEGNVIWSVSGANSGTSCGVYLSVPSPVNPASFFIRQNNIDVIGNLNVTTSYGIYVSTISAYVVQNTIRGIRGSTTPVGIYCWNCINPQVTGNIVSDVGRNGATANLGMIHIGGNSGTETSCIVQDNNILGSTSSGFGLVNGVLYVSSQPVNNGIFSGNIVNCGAHTEVGVHVSLSAISSNLSVDNNQVLNMQSSSPGFTSGIILGSTTDINSFSVSGNAVIESVFNDQRKGIYLPMSSSLCGIVQGNRIFGATSSSLRTLGTAAILASDLIECVFCDNSIRWNANNTTQLILLSNTFRTGIRNNQLHSAGVSAPRYTIETSGTSNNNMVSGNQLGAGGTVLLAGGSNSNTNNPLV